MVHFAGTLSLARWGKKPFFSTSVERQQAGRLNTGIPKVGRVLSALPTQMRPMRVDVRLGQVRVLKGRYKDHLKRATNQNGTYKVKVHIWTDSDNNPSHTT
jgi:hypothetical protein